MKLLCEFDCAWVGNNFSISINTLLFSYNSTQYNKGLQFIEVNTRSAGYIRYWKSGLIQNRTFPSNFTRKLKSIGLL